MKAKYTDAGGESFEGDVQFMIVRVESTHPRREYDWITFSPDDLERVEVTA